MQVVLFLPRGGEYWYITGVLQTRNFISQFWRNTLFIPARKLSWLFHFENYRNRTLYCLLCKKDFKGACDIYCLLCRACTPAEILLENVLNRRMRIEEKQWKRLRKLICDQRRKLWLHHQSYAHTSTLSACRAQFTKQQPEDYSCRRAVSRKSLVFIHSSWWFHVHQRSSHRRTPWASPQHVWVCSLGRTIN
jgi:hypothetical protein